MLAVGLAACAGGGSTMGASPPVILPGESAAPTSQPTGIATTMPTIAPTVMPTVAATVPPIAVQTPPPADSRLHVPAGFAASVIASVGSARSLAALPNGDLLVATNGSSIVIVPNAEGAGIAGSTSTFATLQDSPAQGIAFGGGYVFVATQSGVYRATYATGARTGSFSKIASVRTGGIAPNSDGDVHHTSSIAVSGSYLYVGVGSSCNACAETDPTRATVQRMNLDGSGMVTQATRIRNAMAFATDPSTGNVWAGGAGQDNLPGGHPYEFMDPVSTHPVNADYGWPACEENQHAYTSGANCTATIAPALEFPAYSTLIGASFYPASQGGAYAFPSGFRGGLFVGIHGSWHASNGVPLDAPHVAFVPFSGAAPMHAVNWSDPTSQWTDFFSGFQIGSNRIGRPTGVAVGSSGSLFVADDQTGSIFRIRPVTATAAKVRQPLQHN